MHKLSNEQLLLLAVLKPIRRNAVSRELNRRAELRPLITKAIARETMRRLTAA